MLINIPITSSAYVYLVNIFNVSDSEIFETWSHWYAVNLYLSYLFIHLVSSICVYVQAFALSRPPHEGQGTTLRNQCSPAQ